MIAKRLHFLSKAVTSPLHHVFISKNRDRLRNWCIKIETSQERIWEIGHYLLQRQPTDGEMTAIVRRNGWSSFYTFLFKQQRGDFGRRNFLSSDKDAMIKKLREFPDELQHIIEQADKVVSGEFNLLGSGPIDMRRGKRAQGYQIDWNRDPISGERYRTVFSQWRWNPFTMRRGNADIKGPWELTRCQHFPTLGQAYWLTGDESYAQCYAKTILDFIAHNKPGIGIHWACPMDVSLRLVSWLAALSYFQGSLSLNMLWWRRFLKSLVQHGRHITNNLEFGTLNSKIIVSNHGLANFFGLYWLALNFPGLDAGCVWRGIAEAGLEQQVRLQLLDDGGCFESSVPYHRLVTEIFLSAYALSEHHRLPFSKEFKSRIINALQFIKALRPEGGRMPQIGDADNGRAHIFSGYGRWESYQENMDHLLAAGTILGADDFAEHIEPQALIEQLFWSGPRDIVQHAAEIEKTPSASLFKNAGIAVLRNASTYVVMSNSVCGTFGIGNHKHNDQLALEWNIGSQPIFIDAGSYTYTQDPDARNWFRSTAHHNTLQIDGHEQHCMNPNALFKLEQRGAPSWELAREQHGCIGIRATHSSYLHLSEGLLHERRIIITENGSLIVNDLLKNPGNHLLRWYFLVHPSLDLKIDANVAYLYFEGGSVCFYAPESLSWQIEQAWYSCGYGVRNSTVALVLEASGHSSTIFVGAISGALSHADAAVCNRSFWNDTEFRGIEI